MTECHSFRLDTPDGRRWSIEVHGPGRIRAVHIDSPTGYSEWITEQQAGITWLPARAHGEKSRPAPTRTHFDREGCDPPDWYGPTGE